MLVFYIVFYALNVPKDVGFAIRSMDSQFQYDGTKGSGKTNNTTILAWMHKASS